MGIPVSICKAVIMRRVSKSPAKSDLSRLFILFFSEFLHKPGFAYLACTTDDQRFTVVFSLPFFRYCMADRFIAMTFLHKIECLSVQIHINSNDFRASPPTQDSKNYYPCSSLKYSVTRNQHRKPTFFVYGEIH